MSVAERVQEAERFAGRYWLQEKLAVGGMAEIYLARMDGHQSAKDVVIKRLKPELAADPRLVNMFQDEARVSSLLNHANNVHVFDSGLVDGQPYIAMEYIHGEELNALCRRGIKCGEFLPLEHAVELVRQAALGMGYYHNLRDESGAPLELVHCDISPNNLLVGEDGYLQIIDFGIAQFRNQSYRDGALVPGKLSYMSPEQARREPLDRRSDIFSLGVVLYEITLGRRLFRGPAKEVLPRLKNCEITPPTFVRNDYPGALESIVMKALEADPSERYQEAYELATALGDYLREEQLRTGVVGVARYLDRLAVAEGGEAREEFIPTWEDEAEDEALDFDRGVFQGFQAMVAEDPDAAVSWEDEAEDEAMVAEALGIDVELVRTAARTVPEARPKRSRAAQPSVEESTRAQAEEPGEELAPTPPESAGGGGTSVQPSSGGSEGSMALLWLVAGVLLGAGGAYLLGALQ